MSLLAGDTCNSLIRLSYSDLVESFYTTLNGIFFLHINNYFLHYLQNYSIYILYLAKYSTWKCLTIPMVFCTVREIIRIWRQGVEILDGWFFNVDCVTWGCLFSVKSRGLVICIHVNAYLTHTLRHLRKHSFEKYLRQKWSPIKKRLLAQI